MYKLIMPLLSCPCCKSDFSCHEELVENEEVVEGYIECQEGHRYCIHEGVLDFGSLEQENSNSWSEYYKEMSYEDLDKDIEDRKSENQKMIQEKFLDAHTDRTSKLENGFLLDVASGRGMLLNKLLETTNENVHIISSDLSFAVLMNDRKKFKNKGKGAKVSYVACDATQLPFKDDSIDMICTFVGYFNMLNLYEPGLEASSRVLKPGGSLVNSGIYMDKASQGFAELEKILAENDMSQVADFILKDKLLALHEKYFSKVSDEIIYEGIGEAMEGDLLPYPGAWYANVLINARK